MITDKLKQTIKEEVLKLPKEKQDAVNAVDWVNIAEEIGKEHLLTESEVNDFQVETLLVLIGLTNLDDYAKNIEDNIGTSAIEAKKIAGEAVEKIFTSITDIGIANIKKSLKNKNPSWKQNLNFTLSGGEYSSFLAQDAPLDLTPPSAPLSLLRRGARDEVHPTPPAGAQRRITDLKSRFTI